MKLFRRCSFLLLFCITSFTLHAQVADSIKQYVISCVDTMEKQFLFSKKLNWKNIHDSVNYKLQIAGSQKEAENIVIWVFKQLKDNHGSYNGIDTSYRYIKPGPARKFSAGILAAYKKPRAVKIALLDNGIAYYKMPAVLTGSNKEKMQQWANMLSDSFCKLQAMQPRAYIIDLRMNNGGNIEPMWQALKNLIGEKNQTFIADADKKILPAETDSATLAYKAAAIPLKTCNCNSNIPVAVLIGPGTGSSGEIMALSFTTRKNTRLFGQPSIGVANVTNGFVIQDKGYLLLTVGYIADAKKKVLSKFYIQPDVIINADDNFDAPEKDATIKAAVKWLEKKA